MFKNETEINRQLVIDFNRKKVLFDSKNPKLHMKTENNAPNCCICLATASRIRPSSTGNPVILLTSTILANAHKRISKRNFLKTKT